MKFEDLGLPKKLVDATRKMGFKNPSEIQALAIPKLLEGKDVTAIAQTGTGKTAAFGLPILANLNFREEDKVIKTLILCPTRELSVQSSNAIGVMAINSNMHNFKITAIYGGASFNLQKQEIKSGLDAIVATPGRLVDMLNRKIISLSEVEMVIMDEADEMLKMGFSEDIDFILSKVTQHKVQTCFFSATMPQGILKISQKYQKDPVEIKASKTASTNLDVEQFYSIVPNNKKIEATRRLIIDINPEATIVFVKTRVSASEVSEALSASGITATAISGDVNQNDRERIVEGVRKGKIKVLVATDVAARGLDIKQIGLVINYDLPTENDAYVHRIGRTGRAGRKGISVSLVNPSQSKKLGAIEKLIDKTLDEKTIPTLSQIAGKLVKEFASLIPERIMIGKLDKYKNLVEKIPVFEKHQYDTELLEWTSAIFALAINDYGIDEDEMEFGEKLDTKNLRKKRQDKRENKKSPKIGSQKERDNTHKRDNSYSKGKHSKKFNPRKGDNPGTKTKLSNDNQKNSSKKRKKDTPNFNKTRKKVKKKF